MSQTTEFDIGSEVACSDGVVGDLRRVVLDPVARAITHLVVEPRDRSQLSRLVPVDRVASAGRRVVLTLTQAQFGVLEEAEESQLLASPQGHMGYDKDQVLAWPYFGLHGAGSGIAGRSVPLHVHTGAHVLNLDHVPVGDVEVRRGEPVHATDGPIGHVKGLVIDPSDHHVTHFLLDEGHLWGRRRVAIPITVVERVGDGVRITLTKDEVRDLPAVDVEEHD